MKQKELTKEVLITDTQVKEEKQKIAKYLTFDDHPDTIMKEFIKNLDKFPVDNKSIDSEKFNKLFVKASMSVGLDTHIPTVYAVHEDYRPLVIEFANLLHEEFQISKPSEKALAQVISLAYVRSMVLSRQLTSTLSLGQTSQNLNGFYTVISKDLDRTQRQFTSALTLLKELKSPTIQVNVKTNTAFIAQNQQLNNQQYENNNP